MAPSLADIADQLEARARALRGEGKFEAAAELALAAGDLRKAIGALEGLPAPYQSGNVRDMVTAERVRHSKGTSTDPLVEAANAAHFTMRSLAEKLGVSHALLSQARRGTRSIDKATAEAVEKLTGFPATKGNWPKLRG